MSEPMEARGASGRAGTGTGPDPRDRFSDRVDAYVRHRPTYPREVVESLRSDGLLQPGATVADVGSGTGISSALFVGAGCTVYGVEPNAAMRAAAERSLGRKSPAAPPRVPGAPIHARFHSVNGTAEATTLPDASVDLVVAGQAFHWFDRPPAKAEFRRILRPGGGAALFWNTRQLTGSPFAEGYETLLREYGTDYERVRHDHVDRTAIAGFFSPLPVRSADFPFAQRFDYGGLEGRLLSSSYAPGPVHPRHDPMLAALRRLFEACAVDGSVVMSYRTEVHAGRMRE